MSKNIINLYKSQNSSTTADNDLAFTSQDLNDLAIRIGADLGLPDINDIHVVDESVSSDILVDQSQVIVDDKHQMNDSNDVDMETIVIENINDVDMSDAIVFGNVGNEVSISSSNPFDRQTANSATTLVTKTGPIPRRRGTGGPAKIRAPHPQPIQISSSMSTSQPIRFSNQLVATTQPQIIPINSLNFGNLNTTHVIPTSVATQSKGQTKGKIIKKTTNVSTGLQTTDASTLKVIYTSHGQQIVFSPSKQTTQLNSNQTVVGLQSNTGVAPPGKVLIRPAIQNTTKTMSAMNSSQTQQIYILSPVKTSTGVTQIVPANKLLPPKSQPIIAAKSPQRALAPAPTQSKIAISKASSDVKPVQLIRVVPISSAQSSHQVSSVSTLSGHKLVPLRPIAPNTSVRAIAPIPQSTHKLIVPTSGMKTNVNSLATVTSSGVNQTTFLTTSGPNNSGQVFMLPNPSLLKLASSSSTVPTTSNSSKTVSFSTTAQPRTNFVPIAPSPLTASSSVSALTAAQMNSLKITNGSTKAPEDPHQRKPCNCTKSQCLKLYCDCFANGEFCSACNCISCHNNLEHEEDRQKAIRQCLERNPHAFHPKIGKGRAGDVERRHTKGCNCRRSGCLKNYCECYEAKILCSGLCKCVGCKNFEESFERKTLMHLADAAEVRSAQQNVATKNRLWGSDFKPKLPIRVDADRLPCTFITPEVIEATCQCLLAQAEYGEKNCLDMKHIETLVLEEFGRCLSQIIECAAKTRK